MTTTVLKKDSRHTLSVLVKHNLNTFSRIIGIFSGKGFELESVTFASGARHGAHHNYNLWR